MQMHDAVDDLLKRSGVGINKIQRDVFGEKSKPLSMAKTRQTSYKVETLAKVADYCGYELAFIPKDYVSDAVIPIKAPE